MGVTPRSNSISHARWYELLTAKIGVHRGRKEEVNRAIRPFLVNTSKAADFN